LVLLAIHISNIWPLIAFDVGFPKLSICGLGKTILLFIKITWMKQRLTYATEQRQGGEKVVSSL